MAFKAAFKVVGRIHYSDVPDLPADDQLYREFQTFRREQARLLAEGAEGKCALVKGDEIIGIFADDEAAYRAGCQKYPTELFMVKTIHEWEPIIRTSLRGLPCHISHIR